MFTSAVKSCVFCFLKDVSKKKYIFGFHLFPVSKLQGPAKFIIPHSSKTISALALNLKKCNNAKCNA
jgi:hypothetical protein